MRPGLRQLSFATRSAIEVHGQGVPAAAQGPHRDYERAMGYLSRDHTPVGNRLDESVSPASPYEARPPVAVNTPPPPYGVYPPMIQMSHRAQQPPRAHPHMPPHGPNQYAIPGQDPTPDFAHVRNGLVEILMPDVPADWDAENVQQAPWSLPRNQPQMPNASYTPWGGINLNFSHVRNGVAEVLRPDVLAIRDAPENQQVHWNHPSRLPQRPHKHYIPGDGPTPGFANVVGGRVETLHSDVPVNWDALEVPETPAVTEDMQPAVPLDWEVPDETFDDSWGRMRA